MINLFSSLILFSLMIMVPTHSFMETEEMDQEYTSEFMPMNEEDNTNETGYVAEDEANYSSGDEDMDFAMADDNFDENAQNQDDAMIDEAPEFMDDSGETNIEGYSFEEDAQSFDEDNEMTEEEDSFSEE